MSREFLRRDEPVPLVGARRQPAQYVLGADDGQHVGLEGAVDRRQQHQPTGTHEPGAGRQECADVGHVLHDLEAGDDIERAALGRQLLGCAGAIVDGQPLRLAVPPRRLDVFSSRVEARHTRAEPRKRLADEAAAAADIEQRETRQRPQPAALPLEMAEDLVAQELDTGGPQLVQGAKLAVGIPPLVSHALEAVDFGLVEGRGRVMGGGGAHGAIGPSGPGAVKAILVAAAPWPSQLTWKVSKGFLRVAEPDPSRYEYARIWPVPKVNGTSAIATRPDQRTASEGAAERGLQCPS